MNPSLGIETEKVCPSILDSLEYEMQFLTTRLPSTRPDEV